MQRSLFHSLRAAGLLAALFFMNACQKEANLAPEAPLPVTEDASARYNAFYGITVFNGALQPSQLVQIDQGTGNAFVLPQIFYNGINVTDVRGICYLGSQFKYAITTGTGNPFGVPANSLFTLNIATSEAFYVSTSNVGTVSDIDYDPITQAIYGLNGNNLIAITGGGFNVYTSTPMVGLAPGYVARGLTMFGDINGAGTQIHIACTQNGAVGTTLVYKVAPAGVTGFIGDLQPANELQGANCALSYQLTPNSDLYVNRNAFNPGILVPGLNQVTGGWPQQGTMPTNIWGAAGFNFEDLSSDIGI